MALISLALVIAWTAPPRLSAVEPRTIRVRNIPFESSEQDVQAAISAHFGEVSSVSLAEWGSKGGRKHRGWAVLEFAHSGSRRKALGGRVSIKLDGRELLLEEEEEVAKQSEAPQLKKSRRRPRRQRSKPTVLASRREEALTFLERSRYRDFASKQDYQRAVASALSQIGALGNKDEYSIAIGAACRARDTSRQAPPGSVPPAPSRHHQTRVSARRKRSRARGPPRQQRAAARWRRRCPRRRRARRRW